MEHELSQSWEGLREPAQGSGAEPRDEHPSCCCCCPRTLLQRGVCPKNRAKSFVILQSFIMSQLIFPLVTPEQNQWYSGSSRKIFPINDFQGLGIDFSILSSVIKNIHSPQKKRALFHEILQASSCSQISLVLFKAIVVQESLP